MPPADSNEITERIANDLGTLRNDVSQLMETANNIGTKVSLTIRKVADRIGREIAHMATVPGNAELPDSRF